VHDRPDADETMSSSSSLWHVWYREYETRWNAKVQPILDRFPDRAALIREHLKPTLVPLPAAVERLQVASEDDAKWLIGALRDERRKWFVADIAARVRCLPDALFEPLLRASVEELSPSFNRRFVEPCMRVFGPRRVNEYLLAVLESGDDFHKAGAVSALYWAAVRVSYRLMHPMTSPLQLRSEDADPESQALYDSLRDLDERKRKLFLETFVANPNLDVRRNVIASLELDESAYPDTHKHLVSRAIQIAREHPDQYIRDRVEIQLGEVKGALPIPPRELNRRSN
jgi:hypothetical protein